MDDSVEPIRMLDEPEVPQVDDSLWNLSGPNTFEYAVIDGRLYHFEGGRLAPVEE